MARKLRIQYEGAIHHVTICGVERRIIFDDTSDYRKFIECLGEAVNGYGITVIFILSNEESCEFCG